MVMATQTQARLDAINAQAAKTPTPTATPMPKPELPGANMTPGVFNSNVHPYYYNPGPSAMTHEGLGGASTVGTQNRNEMVGSAVYTNLNDPRLPASAVQTYTGHQQNANEFMDPLNPNYQVTGNYGMSAQTGTAQGAVTAQGVNTSTMQANLIGQGAAGSEQAARQEQLNPNALASAAIGNIPPEMLVNSQMEDLMVGLENGDIPLWARPAVDAIEGQLASRGLSRSSVGQAALTNAIVTAALPIAQQNAQMLVGNFMQDKQSQTQVNLQNAQAGMQLQLTNLSNEQQMAVANLQVRQQSMMSDQAAVNASRQFNAASENQTKQFMSNLQATVDMSNAARVDAMTQFNAGQNNAAAQFSAQVAFARDQFNAQNATAIEQSNVQWRRQINQMDTAGVNAVNQANAMNAFNLSNQALTFMWQEMRDNAKWVFEATQNDAQRQTALAVAALGNETAASNSNMQAISAIGAAALNMFTKKT